jgi:hypothetical protein
VLHWHLYIEEYGPGLFWKKGIENIEAGTLSCYPCLKGENMDEQLFYDDLLLKSFLNYLYKVDNFPLNFPDFAAVQATDATVQNYAAPMQGFAYQDNHGIRVLCRQSTDGQWKIVIPEPLINDTVCWYYHAIMSHVGYSRLYDSLRSLVWFSGMQRRIDAYVHLCDTCQRYKDQGHGQGALPPREDISMLFKEIAAGLIGPWSINIHGPTLQIQALIIIDTATTLKKVVWIEDRSL